MILLLGSVIGMIIYQFVILKFFLCYEALLFIISVVVSISSCRIIGLIIVLYVLWNSTFEVILGLTVLFIQVDFLFGLYSIMKLISAYYMIIQFNKRL